MKPLDQLLDYLFIGLPEDPAVFEEVVQQLSEEEFEEYNNILEKHNQVKDKFWVCKTYKECMRAGRPGDIKEVLDALVSK